MELNINGEVNNKNARGTFYIHVRQIECTAESLLYKISKYSHPLTTI